MTNSEFIQMASLIAKRASSWAVDAGTDVMAKPELAATRARPETIERFKADVLDVFRVWEQ